LWSNPKLVSFLGLAAMITYENLEKDCVVIGLEIMRGKHNAENIKSVIEKIINEYDFDKSKLNGIVCDEGSNLKRLFQQAENGEEDFDNSNDDSNDNDDEYDDYEYAGESIHEHTF
jgi:hypothetical protein